MLLTEFWKVGSEEIETIFIPELQQSDYYSSSVNSYVPGFSLDDKMSGFRCKAEKYPLIL